MLSNTQLKEQMLTSMKDTLDDASHQMVSIEIPEKNIYQKKNKQSSEKNMDTSAEPYSSGDFTIANLEENLIKKSQGDDGKFTNASVPTVPIFKNRHILSLQCQGIPQHQDNVIHRMRNLAPLCR